MSLINCSECGNEVSNKTASCPKCGAPVKLLKVVSEKKKTSNSTVFIALIIGIGFLAILSAGSGHNTISAFSPTSPSKAELMDTTVKIMATCQQRVLGKIQKEGESVTDDQAWAITRCYDEMDGAYIAGVKAGH